MGSIPALFLEADEATVLRQVDKETVVQVHAILVQESPALEALLAQAREWDKQQREAVEAVGLVRQQISRQRHPCRSAPPGWTWRLREESPGKPASDWRSPVRHPGPDGSGEPARGGGRSTPCPPGWSKPGGTGAASPARPRRDGEIPARAGAGIAQHHDPAFAALAAATVRPIAWGQSRASLTSINRQVNSLQSTRPASPTNQAAPGPGDRPTFAEAGAGAFQFLPGLGAQQRELVDLLSQPNLAEWRNWATKHKGLIEDISVYSPENWPRQDDLAFLSAAIRFAVPQ